MSKQPLYYDDVQVGDALPALVKNPTTRQLVRYAGASNFRAYRLMKALSLSDQRGLSRFVSFQGQYTSARSLIEESLALHTEAGSRRGIAVGLCGLGGLTLFEGDP